jgi:hypothetical protein
VWVRPPPPAPSSCKQLRRVLCGSLRREGPGLCRECASRRRIAPREGDHLARRRRIGAPHRGETPHPFGEVGLGDDCVAAASALGLMARQFHGPGARHARTFEVSVGGAAQIMGEASPNVSVLAGTLELRFGGFPPAGMDCTTRAIQCSCAAREMIETSGRNCVIADRPHRRGRQVQRPTAGTYYLSRTTLRVSQIAGPVSSTKYNPVLTLDPDSSVPSHITVSVPAGFPASTSRRKRRPPAS